MLPRAIARAASSPRPGDVKRPRGWGDGWPGDRRRSPEEDEAAIRAIDAWIEATRRAQRALGANRAELLRVRKALVRGGGARAFERVLVSESSLETVDAARDVLDAQQEARRLQSELKPRS